MTPAKGLKTPLSLQQTLLNNSRGLLASPNIDGFVPQYGAARKQKTSKRRPELETRQLRPKSSNIRVRHMASTIINQHKLTIGLKHNWVRLTRGLKHHRVRLTLGLNYDWVRVTRGLNHHWLRLTRGHNHDWVRLT